MRASTATVMRLMVGSVSLGAGGIGARKRGAVGDDLTARRLADGGELGRRHARTGV